MRQRYAWTNQEADNLREVVLVVPDRVGTHPQPRTFYVLPEYEQELRHFTQRVQRFGLAFVICMVVLTMLVIPIATVMRWYAFLGVIVALIGVIFIAFPFATPETVKAIGIKNSIRLARTLGLVIVVVGVYLVARH